MVKTKHDYIDEVKALRQFADGFSASDGYDLRSPLTPSQKRRITINHEKLAVLTSQSVKIKRFRNKKKLKIVQSEVHGGINIPRLKVAFIPVADASIPVDIKIKNGRVITRQRGVITEHINIDPVLLARNAIKAVEDAIFSSSSKRFAIRAGDVHRVESRGATKNGIAVIATRNKIPSNVAKMVERYGSDKYDENDSNSHHYSNWLFGLIGYEFEEFDDFADYESTYQRERQTILDSPFAKRVLRLRKGKGKIKKYTRVKKRKSKRKK